MPPMRAFAVLRPLVLAALFPTVALAQADAPGTLLKASAPLKLYVVGHTDAVGSAAYNKDLSEKRAAAVVQYLVRQHAIAGDRLTPAGVRPLAPVATNATEEGRAKNRRVELVVRP